MLPPVSEKTDPAATVAIGAGQQLGERRRAGAFGDGLLDLEVQTDRLLDERLGDDLDVVDELTDDRDRSLTLGGPQRCPRRSSTRRSAGGHR